MLHSFQCVDKVVVPFRGHHISRRIIQLLPLWFHMGKFRTVVHTLPRVLPLPKCDNIRNIFWITSIFKKRPPVGGPHRCFQVGLSPHTAVIHTHARPLVAVRLGRLLIKQLQTFACTIFCGQKTWIYFYHSFYIFYLYWVINDIQWYISWRAQHIILYGYTLHRKPVRVTLVDISHYTKIQFLLFLVLRLLGSCSFSCVHTRMITASLP